MEGGLTRRYGYVALVALLVAVLLVVLLMPGKTTLPAECEVAESVPPEGLALPSRKEYKPTISHNHSNPPAVSRRYPSTPIPTRVQTVVKVNTSDSTSLQQLHGIGPVLSSRIVRYRELLGGFVSIEQLHEVYGLSDSTYESIAPYLVLDSVGVRQIDINSATIAQLRRHPYIDYYQARAIVQLREQQGPYNTVDELQQVPLIEPETYNRIRPYLTCNLPRKK